MNYIRGDITVVRAILPRRDGQVLVVQRSPLSKTNPNLWEAPGGQIRTAEDSPDGIPEDHIEGVIRRVREGTGLIIGMSGELELIERRLMKDVARAGQLYISLVGTGSIEGGELRLGKNYKDSDWIDLSAIKPYDFTPDTTDAFAIKNRKLYNF